MSLKENRHKTALSRKSLSAPVKALLRQGLLSEGESFFDFGCGKGSDVERLKGKGFAADGWDPHFFPDSEKKEADVVNLGYVLNAIEDPAERQKTLTEAYKLCKKGLMVSLLSPPSDLKGRKKSGDGYVSKNGAFQRFFTKEEGIQYLKDTLGFGPASVDGEFFWISRISGSVASFIPKVVLMSLEELRPYENNARTHSAEQVDQIARSIQEFGFVDPILVDGERGIIAGHGRLMAARKLEMDKVPVIECGHLTPEQKRLLIIAHNRLAENAGWDFNLLEIELAELDEMGFDIQITGFDDINFAGPGGTAAGERGENSYTQKVEIPNYEPSDKCPEVKGLTDRTKADELQAEIRAAKLPKDVEKFLLDAAERFVEFQFDRIADFYAHASPEVQDLMENSALVIVDFNKAIEKGFVRLTEDVDAAFAEEFPDA